MNKPELTPAQRAAERLHPEFNRAWFESIKSFQERYRAEFDGAERKRERIAAIIAAEYVEQEKPLKSIKEIVTVAVPEEIESGECPKCGAMVEVREGCDFDDDDVCDLCAQAMIQKIRQALSAAMAEQGREE